MSRSLPVVIAAVYFANPALSAQGPAPAGRMVVSDGGAMIIAVSQSGKTLYGYSIRTGTWEGVAVTDPDKAPLMPIVGSGVGYVAVGRRVYAFSGATGLWAVLDLPEAAKPRISVAAGVRVDLGSKIYMFSGVTGRWALVDLAVDEG